MRVTDIPLTEVMQKYLDVAEFYQDGSSNRWKTTCPFHNDTSPSLVLFDKTADGTGWDYHCFACGAHGNSMTLLTSLAVSQTEEQAIEMLMRDFGLELPAEVTLREFCKFKGLDDRFASGNGWETVSKGVAIPYYNTKHDLVSTKIRTKYHGKDKYIYQNIAKSPVATMLPYGLHWLDGYSDELLYITEGETDAMTLAQAGFPVLGFPSANGFKPEFSVYLKKFKTLVVVRDNDEPGWNLVTSIAEEFPDNIYMVQLPKGTKDINNYHISICGSNIENFTTMFPTLQRLPASPQTFIEAVKAGHIPPTEKLCWDMVMRYHRSEPEQLLFKDQMAKETKVGKAIITSAMKRASRPDATEKDEGGFIINDNCYYKQVFSGQRTVEVKISNFILVPEYDIRSDDEIVRVVTLQNELNEESKGVRLDAESLTNVGRFNSTIIASGNFIFTGSTEDLFRLCIMIFERSKKTIYSPKRIGRLDTGGWLFGNCGIDTKGEIFPLQHGVVTLDDRTYSPRSVIIEDGDTSTNQGLPTFNLGAEFPDDFLGDVATTLRGCFGTYGAYLALGWCVAGWFSDQIFKELGFYPYLFVSGKRSSGKSVLSTMLQGTYGFDAATAGMSIETPSNVGILRYLAYRSSLPAWYDDYRAGVRRIQMKDGLLLDVYNRHGSVKGTREAGAVVSEPINGFVLLSGEDTPTNNALLTRCVVVQLSAFERNSRLFGKAQSLMQQLRDYAPRWAAESTKGTDLVAEIRKLSKTIEERNGDVRYAQNYGIFAAAFLWAFGDQIPDRQEFMDFVLDNAYTERVESDASHPLAEFFTDIPDLLARQLIQRDREFAYDPGSNTVAVRLRETHKAWCDYHKRTPISEPSLRNYIRKEAFFVAEERVYFPVAGRFRSFILDLRKMEEEFIDFVEVIRRSGDNSDY